MQTLKADAKRRVRIPDAKPHQVFSYVNQGDGRFTLTVVQEAVAEKFPPGSLTKYFTGKLGRERDELETAIASGCAKGPA